MIVLLIEKISIASFIFDRKSQKIEDAIIFRYFPRFPGHQFLPATFYFLIISLVPGEIVYSKSCCNSLLPYPGGIRNCNC